MCTFKQILMAGVYIKEQYYDFHFVSQFINGVFVLMTDSILVKVSARKQKLLWQMLLRQCLKIRNL